jgi:hypothetical protein
MLYPGPPEAVDVENAIDCTVPVAPPTPLPTELTAKKLFAPVTTTAHVPLRAVFVWCSTTCTQSPEARPCAAEVVTWIGLVFVDELMVTVPGSGRRSLGCPS